MKIQLKTKTSVVPRWIIYINDFSAIFFIFYTNQFHKTNIFLFQRLCQEIKEKLRLDKERNREGQKGRKREEREGNGDVERGRGKKDGESERKISIE